MAYCHCQAVSIYFIRYRKGYRL